MKFQLLLLILGLKLRAAAAFSTRFRRALRGRDCVITIRTADGLWARSYAFRRGRVSASRPAPQPADAELVWCDADTALKALLSRNDLDLYSAIGRRQLAILGNLEHAFWFADIAA